MRHYIEREEYYSRPLLHALHSPAVTLTPSQPAFKTCIQSRTGCDVHRPANTDVMGWSDLHSATTSPPQCVAHFSHRRPKLREHQLHFLVRERHSNETLHFIGPPWPGSFPLIASPSPSSCW